MEGELFIEIFGEIVFRIFLVILKGIWVSILWLFNVGQIPFMMIWEKPTSAWRGGLALGATALSILLFMIFKSNS